MSDSAASPAEREPEPGFGVAVAQFAPGPVPSSNLVEITALAERAAARGAGLVVFPEYANAFTPKPGPEWLGAAEPLGGPFVTALAALAERLGIHLVAGLLETAPGTARVRNTVVAVSPADGLVAKYRKMHLYDAFGQRESEWVEPGGLDEPELFEAGGLRFGLETCYDARFPEVSRRLVDAGADVICMPAEWVRGPLKEAHWRTLVTARAIENTVYVLAADHPAPVGAGNSMIVDPMGVELATVGEGRGLGIAWVDAGRIRDVRRTNPALELRRFTVVPR
ncbi:carbon-nitrogen hydrolase family protein [Agromyces archimandritae]|uniref:Carbon-nitrogen hydrolase family protein n=1 Tax=Agromyces archimandritae TaxID=2781962 RepID=A0A975IN83_9MICO|nr:carbon-nitrogen hydrolase family protein [Agromyces archimandritae]QTX04295.1 carbon-nitrogen hydrolase family protein [Agromyces archimandritae]